jgi:hypothetical protein
MAAIEWVCDFDEHSNTTWEGLSPFKTDSDPDAGPDVWWRLTQKLVDDAVVWVEAHDAECPKGDVSFATIEEAKAFVQGRHDEIVNAERQSEHDQWEVKLAAATLRINRMVTRVAGDKCGDCPFCESLAGTSSHASSPQCGLCQLEELLELSRADQNDKGNRLAAESARCRALMERCDIQEERIDVVSGEVETLSRLDAENRAVLSKMLARVRDGSGGVCPFCQLQTCEEGECRLCRMEKSQAMSIGQGVGTKKEERPNGPGRWFVPIGTAKAPLFALVDVTQGRLTHGTCRGEGRDR